MVFLAACAKGGPKGGGIEMPPPVVLAQAVETHPWQQEIHATGSLSALDGIMVRPEIAGRVTQIYFQSGEDVKQGTPLIALDQDILQAQLKSYQANLVLRKQQYDRSIKLYKLNAIAQADLQTAESNLRAAQAQTDEAAAQLKQAIITAPFNGRLGLRLVSVGDYVTPGQNIVNLQSLNPIVVNFSVPEVYLNKISVGDGVEIHADGFPNQTFTGRVYAMDSVIDPNTRTLSMRATIANPDKKLLPGSFVEVALFAGQSQQVITIPQIAILSSLEGSYVYRLIDGKAIQTPIEILSRGDETAVIKTGLKPGDVIITDGQIKITQNDTPVMAKIITAKVTK